MRREKHSFRYSEGYFGRSICVPYLLDIVFQRRFTSIGSWCLRYRKTHTRIFFIRLIYLQRRPNRTTEVDLYRGAVSSLINRHPRNGTRGIPRITIRYIGGSRNRQRCIARHHVRRSSVFLHFILSFLSFFFCESDRNDHDDAREDAKVKETFFRNGGIAKGSGSLFRCRCERLLCHTVRRFRLLPFYRSRIPRRKPPNSV